MFSFKRKRKPTDGSSAGPEDKLGFKNTIKNDLLGVEDWRRSKIGYITGFSSAYRMVAGIGNSVSDSKNRLTSLLEAVNPDGDEVAGLPASLLDESFSLKFEEAARLHRRTDKDLLTTIRNTARNGYFFLVCTFGCLVISMTTAFIWPPEGPFSAIVRLGPAPLAAALAFRSLYTNWMFRNRVLCPPIHFIRSKRWLPLKNFE